MNLAKLMDCGIRFSAVGGILGIICELISLFWQFYYAHLAAVLCFGAGCLAGAGYAIWKRASMEQAARRLDSYGLKERMVTAYEQLDRDNEFAGMQRADAISCYEQLKDRIRIKIFPEKRHIFALLLSLAAVVFIGALPSAVREQAGLRHRVQEQAKEDREVLEALVDALENVEVEYLTQEQKTVLQELTEAMRISGEELTRANSWESLSSALSKLDYKYGQAAAKLESLAGALANPKALGIASAEELAKAAANRNRQLAAAGGTPAGSGDGSGADALTGEGNEVGSGKESGSGNGSQSGEGNGKSAGNGDGDSNGEGAGNGSGDGNGAGSGDGDGNGEGAGNGSGDGNGAGSGDGGNNGAGAGRGTGSGSSIHDYVSIPNEMAQAPVLTGHKNGDQDSEYYRQQNSLAWEGEHVDYNSVIGQYTDNAYEGIANGRYPSGMESVIRDYFESLSR